MTEIKEVNLLFKLKNKNKNNNNKGFSRNLYKKENDVCEYNSGESLVDTTGYIPLGELIQRCGLKVQNPDWSTMNFNTDKFTDRFDSENEIRDLLNKNIKDKEVVNDKNSKGDNTSTIQSETVAEKTQENTASN